MKVLMTGPMYGHNILPFLEFFQERPEHELHFVYASDRRNTFTPEQFPRITFHRLDKNPFRAFDYLRFIGVLRSGFDLIWFHSAQNWPLFLYFVLFHSRATHLNANTWNETIPREAMKATVKGAVYRYCFRRCDSVQCNWHSTYNLMRQAVPQAGAFLQPWGLARENFGAPPEQPETDEARRFIASLPPDKFKFFVPKSMTPFNRHDAIIGAARLLRGRGLDDFAIYFWGGNERDDELIARHQRDIRDMDLSDHVRIVEHSFLPASDIACIWSRMDGGLAIGDRDQLSSTFMEPLIHEKEIVASDIEAYRYFNEEYDAGLDLVENTHEAIADAIEPILRGERTAPDALAHRRRAIEENLDFDRNVEKTLRMFESQRRRRPW